MVCELQFVVFISEKKTSKRKHPILSLMHIICSFPVQVLNYLLFILFVCRNLILCIICGRHNMKQIWSSLSKGNTNFTHFFAFRALPPLLNLKFILYFQFCLGNYLYIQSLPELETGSRPAVGYCHEPPALPGSLEVTRSPANRSITMKFTLTSPQ